MCLSTVNRLKTSGAVSSQAQKILSFTDNRQDASLQAGHFNDFGQTSLLRASLNGAMRDKQKLTHKDSAQELIPDVNVKPDFLYKKEQLAIFCDGSVHDHPEQQEQDRIDRDNLKHTANYSVVVLRYDEDWRSQLNI